MSETSKASGDEWLDVGPDTPEVQVADSHKCAPASDYKVGPGRPPRETQWKKNGPSPNPRGRPRKEQSMAPDLKNALTAALNRKVRVSRGEKQILMTRAEAGIEQLLNQFAKGDRYARRDLMAYADKLGIDFLAQFKQTIEDALPSNLQAILDAYVARQRNVAPTTPVLAPPDLLDDDRAEHSDMPPSIPEAKTEPRPSAPAPAKNEATPAAPSRLLVSAAPASISVALLARSETAPTPKLPKAQPARRPAPTQVNAQTAPTSPPSPDPEPNPLAPKPFSRMRWTERRAWYPEWWARYAKWCAEQGI